jgi:hypothetical protein
MSSAKVSRTKKEVESKVDEVVISPEPVVETKQDDNQEGGDDKVTFESLMDSMTEEYKTLCASIVSFKAKLVGLRRAHNQAMRQQSSRKKTRKAVVDSGILKPVPLPVEAEAFLKDIGVAIPESNLMRRTELSASIYEYVKSKTLYKADPSKESGFDRKVIIPDAKLRKLFSLTADQTLDFSSINVNLATIYRKSKEALAGGAPVPVVASNASNASKSVAPAPAAVASKKGGKVAGASA